MSDSLAAGARMLAGRYELGERIGRGGMSDVYVGNDTRLGRKVAVKLLRANLAEDPAFRARFRREAQDAAKMAHPTIVRVFDAGEESVREAGEERLVPFIVMEYIDGQLLSDVIRQGPMAPREAARIMEQVLIALEYSHRAGVVHRDIKPQNIMLTRNGQVKVMDFGIARAVSDTAANLADTSKVIGTAQYFSPEQARGDRVDARTDLYAAGVVLFELLTGRAPFLGENPVAVAYQHVSAEPPIPSTLNPAVTPAVDAVVLKSLAKEPGLRYQEAADFRTDLVAAVNGQLPVARSVVARPDAFAATLFGGQTAAQSAAVRQLTSEVDDRALRTQSGPPVLWIWTGVIALVVILGAVVFWIANLKPTDVTQGAVVHVPSVVGQRYDDVTGELQDTGLTIDRQDRADDQIASGTIISTDPAAGTAVDRGTTLHVVVSQGRADVAIPDVARLDEASAKAALEAKGFVVGATTTTTDPSVPSGAVVATSPAGGADQTAPSGSTIDLVVSNGLVTVPDMTGQPVQTARDAFAKAGLDIGSVVTVSNCPKPLTVTWQRLVGDVPQGSTQDYQVCAGNVATQAPADAGD